MNLWSKLQSPVALALEGFILGAILFFAMQPAAGAERATPGSTGGSVIETLRM